MNSKSWLYSSSVIKLGKSSVDVEFKQNTNDVKLVYRLFQPYKNKKHVDTKKITKDLYIKKITYSKGKCK